MIIDNQWSPPALGVCEQKIFWTRLLSSPTRSPDESIFQIPPSKPIIERWFWSKGKNYRGFGSFVGLHLFCRQAHRPYLPWNSTYNTRRVTSGCEKHYVPGSKSGITFNLSRTLQRIACLSWALSFLLIITDCLSVIDDEWIRMGSNVKM